MPSSHLLPHLLPHLDPTHRARTARAHWPHGMCFTPEQEALIARGWPRLRILVDGDPRDQKPAVLAGKVRRAIDPVLPIYWPREAARHFVCAGAGTEPDAVSVAHVDAIVDAAIGVVIGYKFLVEDAVLLCEAFLGADAVADRILARLERATATEWACKNPHDKIIVLISLLEPLLLRASAPAPLTARLRALGGVEGALPAVRLRMLLAGHVPHDAEPRGFVYDVPSLAFDDLPRYLAHKYADWLLSPQHLWLAGPGIVDEPRHLAPMRRMPPWRVRAACEAFGIVNHPIVVRMMTLLAGCRAAGGLPEAWLAAHGAPVAAAKAVPAKPLTKKQLDAAIAQLFDRLVAEVERVRALPKGKRAAEERRVWTTAVHELIELRAGAGDPTPEFHVGHILFVDGWSKRVPPLVERIDADDAELARWGKIVTEATNT
ncbi:MAG: hypothetical protein KF773_15295 [Deltaproteobacteria bacterium]|nr:hypothetical protein [Deltaproteobacteria bacterium]